MKRRVVVATAALSLAGCAATTTPQFREARSAELAKAQIFEAFDAPCSSETPPNFELPSDAPDPPATVGPEPGPFRPGVFLDTALFLLPTATAGGRRSGTPEAVRLPASRESLTRNPSVRLLATTHLSAEFDTTSRVAVEDHTGPLAQTTLRELSATPKQAHDAQLAIELDAILQLPTPQATPGRPPESQIHFLTAPRVGQPVALTAQIPEQPGQSLLLLLTPYAIRGEADLRAIFLCKMARRQRAVASGR